jgi:hypothetical protein
MLEFATAMPGKGETLQTVPPRTLHSATPPEQSREKELQRKRLTAPPVSVRDFLEHRESAAGRTERKDLARMIEDLREQLLRVEATIRIFRRMEASERRASARPASRPAPWTTPRRAGNRPSSV